ncbi:MAG: bifunctional oligoribonuclease/PAP phosphatase NrnA [Verrucomicrobiaceae bacterium]|nr:bifunctional oligoribonuclease/PAP phosphatase NrnA [Verrucomicrobiaceae bacterium]
MELKTNTNFAGIAATLRGAQRIALVSHVRPDGDAVGSLLGLALSLRQMGKTVYPLLEDGVPENLMFLPETGLVMKPGSDPLMDLDVAIALDTATHERIGEGCMFVLSGAAKLVNIDHHGSNPGYGDLFLIDSREPATGQIIYKLLRETGMPIDDAVRQHLFAAISTDTGSFQFSCTTADSHRIAAEMMEAGLDIATLCRALYHTYPKRRLELQKALLNEMQFCAGDRIVSWILTKELMDSVAMLPGDTEGLIDTLRAVDSVVSAVIFEEVAGGKIRVSARSKDTRLNVANVCAQFGGGGHAMAAGARIKGTAAEVSEKFLAALEAEVAKLG